MATTSRTTPRSTRSSATKQNFGDDRGLSRAGLQRILDFVPNHMGVCGADNPLWLDVLEWGPECRYAGWFDIDWSAHYGAVNKLLAPVLGDQYGEELRRAS